MRADKQTRRHDDRNTSVSFRGRTGDVTGATSITAVCVIQNEALSPKMQ